MNPFLKIYSCLFFMAMLMSSQAQEVVSTCGGEAAGAGGSSSFTVGQIAYTSNLGTTGSVLQGVQQSFEISPMPQDVEASDIELFLVYPNPTSDCLILSNKNKGEKFSYQLFDIRGNLIETAKFDENETLINMRSLSPATYFLKIFKSNKEIKTFKITKN